MMAATAPKGTDAFSTVNVRRLTNKNNVRITDKKTDAMFQAQRQKQVAKNAPTHPGAKHHTHRVELPGKHRQGPWFNIKQNNNKSTSKKKASSRRGGGSGTPVGRGRTWSYGRVPWW